MLKKELKNIESSLHKTRGVKAYDKVLKRIGRLTEKYCKIARFYKITVKQNKETGQTTSITWELTKQKQMEENFSGGYFIKTSKGKC